MRQICRKIPAAASTGSLAESTPSNPHSIAARTSSGFTFFEYPLCGLRLPAGKTAANFSISLYAVLCAGWRQTLIFVASTTNRDGDAAAHDCAIVSQNGADRGSISTSVSSPGFTSYDS